jgi:quercetin dioxygenase-like cupin family protein
MISSTQGATMQFIKKAAIPVLKNSGVESEQLLFPESSPESLVTITRVSVPVGATNPRHLHESSEQVWVVLAGQGTLLLDGAQELAVNEGDVVRFAPGDVHGFFNSGQTPFNYISVTTPPLNFRSAYAKDWSSSESA